MEYSLPIALTAIALCCTSAGGLLAAIDAAYTSLSRSDLDELATEHPAKAALLTRITEQLERHLRALSFVRVTADTLAAVLMTVAFDTVFDSVWITLVVAAAAIALVNIIVIGVSPRKIGVRNPERIVRATAGLVRGIDWILTPVSPVMNVIGQRASSAHNTRDERMKNEQIFSLVDRAADQELIEEEEQDIIHSVVEFSDMLVKEVMVPRTDMVTLDARSTVNEAFEFFLGSPFSRIPVIDGDSDQVVGVLTLRDVASYVHRRPDEAERDQVTRIMKQPQFVSDLQRTDDLLRQMQHASNHIALAVDEYGGIAGLVTLEDLIEELIGEIYDEHDREVPEAVRQADGSFVVSGKLDIEEFGELFGVDLDDDDVETVAGLVAKDLGRLAETGDTLVVGGIHITVAEVEKKRQRLVTVVARYDENSREQGTQ